MSRAWLCALVTMVASCAAPSADRVTLSPGGDGPAVLVVVAHPDDEIAFAGLLYKTATHLGGSCDIVTITNGEGGYKYSTLAERLYGWPLTDEVVGRRRLPEIRKRELADGCRLLGIRELIQLDQQDHRYTKDVTEILGEGAEVWDLRSVAATLDSVLAAGDYDFVVVHTPVKETHGHHKAASVLALEAVKRLPTIGRPVVMCVRSSSAERPLKEPFAELDGYPITGVSSASPLIFDRTQKFGHKQRLDYRIVANWAIAAHKSQGTMQLLMNGGERENYFLFDLNDEGAAERAARFFARLAEPQYPSTPPDPPVSPTG